MYFGYILPVLHLVSSTDCLIYCSFVNYSLRNQLTSYFVLPLFCLGFLHIVFIPAMTAPFSPVSLPGRPAFGSSTFQLFLNSC